MSGLDRHYDRDSGNLARVMKNLSYKCLEPGLNPPRSWAQCQSPRRRAISRHPHPNGSSGLDSDPTFASAKQTPGGWYRE